MRSEALVRTSDMDLAEMIELSDCEEEYLALTPGEVHGLLLDLREARGVLRAVYDVCSRGIVPNAYETAQLIRPLLGGA